MNLDSNRSPEIDQSNQTNVVEPATWECGRSLRLAGDAAEAVPILRRGVVKAPGDYRLHDELGMALCELNRHEEAIGSFLAALQCKPDLDQVCYKIGLAFSSRGMHAPSVEWFERAREMNPKETKYLGPCGRALAQLGRFQRAAEVFQQWAEAEPDNPVPYHLSNAALGSQEPTRAPAGYVRKIFDEHAPEFDEKLSKLKYCGPRLIFDALQQVVRVAENGWDILDVGCGTGLVGVQLGSLARRLVGVDLSARMLDIARQRNVYDELIEADLFDYLGSQGDCFDVVTAGDVLPYIGDLGDFFRCGAQALRPGGVVVVVLEALDGDGTYRLNPTGRFSHSRNYLRSTMDSAGFSVLQLREDVSRHESEKPVPSFVAVGSKIGA